VAAGCWLLAAAGQSGQRAVAEWLAALHAAAGTAHSRPLPADQVPPVFLLCFVREGALLTAKRGPCARTASWKPHHAPCPIDAIDPPPTAELFSPRPYYLLKAENGERKWRSVAPQVVLGTAVGRGTEDHTAQIHKNKKYTPRNSGLKIYAT
jgi:hypothetical protein